MRRDELNLPDPPPYDRPGDTWHCGDSNSCCPNGPSRNGRCPMADACTPKRTWFGKRRVAVFSLLAATAIIAAVSLRPGVAPTVFKPGPLASPHKQILAGTLTSERCTACHRSASISPSAWFDSAGEGHQDVSQSDRCLDCHHQTIKPNVAKLAHNLPSRVRDKIRGRIQLASARSTSQSWHDRLPGPAIDQENVECSACHREHRGSQADLLAVSDAQCQTCHSDRFGDFASSHPEWSDWPYGRGGDIAFNHQSHMAEHFPKTIRNGLAVDFRCTACHQTDEKNELSRSVSYEVGCKSCHDEALQTESAKGIELVSLPLLPERAATHAGGWPEAAVGMMDGAVTPLTELLMRGDGLATEALRQVPDRNFGRLPPNSPIANNIVPVAIGHRSLLQEMANEGHPAILRRASLAGVSPDSLQEIIRTLPPQLVYETYVRWFGGQLPTIPNQTSSRVYGGIRLVDFAEEIKKRKAKSNEQKAESILLPIDEESWLQSPRIAQKRPQTRKIIKNLDNASDDELLGGEIELPKSFSGKPNAFAPTKRQPTKGLPAKEQPTEKLPAKRPPAKQRPVFKDPGALLDIPPEEDSLLDMPKIARPKNKQPAADDLLVQPKNSGNALDAALENDSLLLPTPSIDDDLLTDDLMDGAPLIDEPLNKAPLSEGLLADDMQGDDLLTGDDDPLMDDPLAEDPLANDPLAADPLSEDPLGMNDRDLLLDDPLSQSGTDPLALGPESASPLPAKRFNPSEMIPAGGWYVDDLRMSIGYRGNGHSDSVLRAAVEMVRQLPANDPVRQRLLATQSVAACVSCHSSATNTNPSWTGRALVGDRTQFTKFTHGPHMNVAGLTNCVHCHKVNKDGESQNPVSLASFSKETNPRQIKGHEFLPIKRAACAACHTSHAAGESCVQCHRYHIDQ